MKIEGKNINLRFAEVGDAEFILRLRTDPSLNRHLSATDASLPMQQEWLRNYKVKEQNGQEFYFIITGKDEAPLGTVRLYDFQNDSFCWGSWIVLPEAPRTTAVESALLVYECAFYKLGFLRSHFDVRKANERVLAFHRRFGASEVGEDEDNVFFNFSREDYECIRAQYVRFMR